MQEFFDLLQQQRQQYTHDRRNHVDILNLSKTDRLKHYGLHFAKYVGRLARGIDEPKSVERTIVDTFLVSLSAANTLHQELPADCVRPHYNSSQFDRLYVIADAAGRFADACEKVDHMEEFIPQAKQANIDVMRWVFTIAAEQKIDLGTATRTRRKELADRQFYIAD